jgi:hypothetical protein
MAAVTLSALVDIDDLEEEVIIVEQNSEHLVGRNQPCNCKDCVAFAMVFGAAKVELADGAWRPVMQGDVIEMVSAADLRKLMVTSVTMETMASNMAGLLVRSFRKEPPAARVTTKRKADAAANGGASAKRLANTALAASAVMPRT